MFKTNGRDECVCNALDNALGKCVRKYDDNYANEKFCYADNVIYFWKGKKYITFNTEFYTYYKNAVLKNEECPEGTKSCGIIDDNENKLCIKSTSNCPINYFSETKLDENILHSSVIIGDKVFYYTFDDKTLDRKIIAGLVADTDLYLNTDNDKKILIDTDTISGFLEYNKNLYKEIDLGYDPYHYNNIDEKGNSYLRIYYNNNLNLIALRESIELYNERIRINKDFIKPINKRIKYSSIFGFIGSLSLIVIIIYILGEYGNSLFIHFTIGIGLISFIVVLILVSKNISKLKKLINNSYNDEEIFNSLIANILILCLFIFSIPYTISLFFCECDYTKCNICKECDCTKCNICKKKESKANQKQINEKPTKQ